MTNYDGTDRLSPGDEPLLAQDRRDHERRYAAMSAVCAFCEQPDDTQTGTCVRCEVVVQRNDEWWERGEAS